MAITAVSYDFSDLQNEVTDLIKPLSSIPDYSSLNADKDHYINRGYVDFVRRIGGIEDKVTITSAAGQTSYTYSDTGGANLQYGIKIIQVRYDSTVYNRRGNILKPYPGGYKNLPSNVEMGTPTYYWYRYIGKKDGIEIGTVDLIGASGADLNVWFTRYPTSLLSNATDEPELPIGYQEAIVNFAVWKMYKIYEHRNEAWAKKATEHRDLYFELVNDYIQTFINTEEVGIAKKRSGV